MTNLSPEGYVMNSGFIFVLAIIIGVSVLWVSSYMLMKRSEKKRTEHFQEAASELGRPFFPEGDDTLLEHLDHFYLFSRGFNKRILNLLYGESDKGELLLFDYQYITGGGRSSKAWNQSVIYFHSPTLDLPLFVVRPKGLLQKNKASTSRYILNSPRLTCWKAKTSWRYARASARICVHSSRPIRRSASKGKAISY